MTGQSGEMSGAPERIETIVIGGGQAGLAVGYHLTRQGRPFVILDANERIGDAWRKRWDSLRVFTPARYDGLPGMPFPAPACFVSHQGRGGRLPGGLRGPIRSSRSNRRPGGRPLQGWGPVRGDRRRPPVRGRQRGGGHRAHITTPRVPAFASELDPAIVQMHSSEYRNPSQLREGGVLVVGAGNSGAEIALEASRGHRTWLSGRDTGPRTHPPRERAGQAGHPDDVVRGHRTS